jgi:hypothetical protein
MIVYCCLHSPGGSPPTALRPLPPAFFLAALLGGASSSSSSYDGVVSIFTTGIYRTNGVDTYVLVFIKLFAIFILVLIIFIIRVFIILYFIPQRLPREIINSARDDLCNGTIGLQSREEKNERLCAPSL